MRLLLDTHAMHWYVEGDPRLSAAAATLIQVGQTLAEQVPIVSGDSNVDAYAITRLW